MNSGGLCGGQSTAFNILNIMAKNAQVGDVLMLVGDFNANAASRTLQSLWGHLDAVYNSKSFGGVDNILANVAGQWIQCFFFTKNPRRGKLLLNAIDMY